MVSCNYAWHKWKRVTQINHIFEALEEETQRIAETVRSLIAFAQPREPEKKVVDLNDILKEVIRSFKESLQERDLQIVESFDKDLPT